MAANRVTLKQGADRGGMSWGLMGELLDVEPCIDRTLGPILVLWFGLGESGLTCRVAIPAGDADRLMAEIDAAREALASGDEDDDEE